MYNRATDRDGANPDMALVADDIQREFDEKYKTTSYVFASHAISMGSAGRPAGSFVFFRVSGTWRYAIDIFLRPY